MVKGKSKIIATLDIETKDGLRGREFKIGAFYTEIGKKKYVIVDEDLDTFMNKVLDFVKERKYIIFIHNLSFDIRFIMDYYQRNTKVKPFIVENNDILEVRYDNLIFRDSFQFLLSGQEEAEKILLREKIKYTDIKFDETTTDEDYRKRVISDVKSLYLLIKVYNDFYKNRYKVSIWKYTTLPSLAISILHKYFKKYGYSFAMLNPYIRCGKDYHYYWKSEQMRDLFYWTRQAYFGGRTEIFKMGLLKNLYYYDFNSLYPHVCINNKFPNPTDYDFYNSYSINKFLKNVYKKKMYIIEATVEENEYIPVLPVRHEGLKFYAGKKRGTWASAEFDYFIERGGKIIEIHSIKIYHSSDYYLKPFFKELYYERLKAKRNKDKVTKYFLKILMNSAYGKFGERPNRENWRLGTFEDYEKWEVGGYEEDEVKVVNGYIFVKEKTERLRIYMIIDFAVFITAYARLKLVKLMHQLEDYGYKVVYCDTDSVITNCEIEKDDRLKHLIGDLDGMLKNEIEDITGDPQRRKILRFSAFLPKVYWLHIDHDEKPYHVKIKGVSKRMITETLGKDSYNEALKEFSSYYRVCEIFKKEFHADRYLKYRSAIRREGKVLASATLKRRILKEYDKRKVLLNGSTKPFYYLNEIIISENV